MQAGMANGYSWYHGMDGSEGAWNLMNGVGAFVAFFLN